jgi:hypothetical protein
MTFFVQGGEALPCLRKFHGEWMPYEAQFHYKYQLLIDGNASSYTASGWRFFTGGLIFKPESLWRQWYYGALQPGVHYIPLRADLSDLIEKIHWARVHDAEAATIAKRARQFALSHLLQKEQLAYLYFLLQAYHHLNFV